MTFGEGALDLTAGSSQFTTFFWNAALNKTPFDPTPATKVGVAVLVATGRDLPLTSVSYAVAAGVSA